VRWLAWILAACGAPDVTVFVPTPPLHPRAASILFVVEGDSPFLYADDLPATTIDEVVPWKDPASFTAFAFFYPRPLAAYGLVEGSVTPAGDGSRACGLSTPLAVLRLAAGETKWAPAGDAPLRRITVAEDQGCRADDLCVPFEAEALELETIENVSVVIAVDGGRALVASTNRAFYDVDRLGATRRPDLEGLPADGGARTEDGEIWLGGGGELARGTIAGGFLRETIGTIDERVSAIAPRGSGADTEILILSLEKLEDVATSTVRVRLFAGGELRVIHRRVVTRATWRQGGIAWSPSGEALIVIGGAAAFRYERGAVTPLSFSPAIPLLDPDLNGVVFSPGEDAYLIGGGDGFVYRLSPSASAIDEIIPDLTLGNKIQGLALAGDGLLFGGPDGKMGQFHPGGAPCDVGKIAASDVERIVPIGDAILVAGGNPDRSVNNRITWLVP
jgi:hypothetical protein